VSELPAEMQPKLLRVLESGEFEPVGDDQTRKVNVRIIAATNRDLRAAASAGRFREDLYYRLSVFPLEVPPLRERKDDIPILAKHFLEAACRRFNRPGLQLSAGKIRNLQSYDWPGNVRELQNVLERAVITSRSRSPHLDILEAAESGPPQKTNLFVKADSAVAIGSDLTVIPDSEMKRRERENIIAALKLTGGRIYGPAGAAELLEIKPTTLSARVKKLGLKQFSSA
jgi:transcriptional regulator with GAF, ATPase, and Fis domain